MIGNAVPVKLAASVAAALREYASSGFRPAFAPPNLALAE